MRWSTLKPIRTVARDLKTLRSQQILQNEQDMCGLLIFMTHWNDGRPVARWEQPRHETVKKIYHSHLAPRNSNGSPPVTSHPGARLTVALTGPWKTAYEIPPPPFNCALCDHKNIFPLLRCFDCFLRSAEFHSHPFSKSIFMSYFVNFPLIHSKRLSALRGSITTAITWSLLNHTASNLLSRTFPCTFRGREVSEMSEAKSSSHQDCCLRGLCNN